MKNLKKYWRRLIASMVHDGAFHFDRPTWKNRQRRRSWISSLPYVAVNSNYSTTNGKAMIRFENRKHGLKAPV